MIVLYTKKNCPDCNKAKALLMSNGLNYNEMVIGEDLLREDFISLFPEIRTVPYIIENGNKIGGYAQLLEWLNNRPQLLID